MRIKFCGITRVEDALASASLGVDAIGLVFVHGSARCVDLDSGQAIRRALPPFVTLVALFLDAEPAWIGEVLERVRPDALQFHGREVEADCRRWGRPYLKALAMGSAGTASTAPSPAQDIHATAQPSERSLDALATDMRGNCPLDWKARLGDYPSAQGFVLDSHAEGGMGGSGAVFDWSRLAPPHPRPLILAGGLRPDNVAEAVRVVDPHGVDVSSGIESAPGLKSPARMKSFIEEVRGVVNS